MSSDILKDYCDLDVIETFEYCDDLNTKVNTWNSFIFVGGTKFRCMFLAQFTTISLLGLASEKFVDIKEVDYIHTVKDFMREYCNQFAGKLKACFEQENDVSLSLPIISRDFDVRNIFNIKDEEITIAQWSLGEEKNRINIKLYFYEKEKFPNFDFIDDYLNKQSTKDEIDFF